MGTIPSLRALEKSNIDPDEETLEQRIEEVVLDNITSEQLEKLSEYKQKINDIIIRLGIDEVTEFFNRIDVYIQELKGNEELENIELTNVLLFQFISSDEECSSQNDSYMVDYDLPYYFSIERFLIEIIDIYS